MDSTTAIIAIVTAILGGGGLSALILALASRRAKTAEGRAIEVKAELQIVDAAKSLLGVSHEEIARLATRLSDVETKNNELDSEISDVREANNDLKASVSKLQTEVDKLETANETLRERCTSLELENVELRKLSNKED